MRFLKERLANLASDEKFLLSTLESESFEMISLGTTRDYSDREWFIAKIGNTYYKVDKLIDPKEHPTRPNIIYGPYSTDTNWEELKKMSLSLIEKDFFRNDDPPCLFKNNSHVMEVFFCKKINDLKGHKEESLMDLASKLIYALPVVGLVSLFLYY